MQGRKIYQEKLFTTFRLSDRVPKTNFYRRLNECLDLNFLYKETAPYYGKEGNAGLDPVVFFKLLLTGYFQNISSDRAIIENARLRMDILYFIGYDIDEELPWHSTLSRTRQLLGIEVFQSLFKKVLEQCIIKGMVAGERQAIDSVQIKSNASMDSLRTLKLLEDGNRYVASLIEDEEIKPTDEPTKGKGKYNSRSYSTTDPDARISSKKGKPRQLNYLGQLSVDTAHHVITSIAAHHADKRDSECFEQVLEQAINNLKGNDLKVKQVMADTNYSSADALKACIKNHVEAYIPNMGQYKLKREGFSYNAQEDYYQCANGVKLLFKELKASRKTFKRDYRSSSRDCKACSLKPECLGKKRYKSISHTVDKELFEQMHIRMQSAYGKRMRKLRQSTVEPVIGSLVNNMASKKIRTIGIQQANKYLIGAAIAYNIKKWMKWQDKKRKTAAMALSLSQKLKRLDSLPVILEQMHVLLIAIRTNQSPYRYFLTR
jgi:transposase